MVHLEKFSESPRIVPLDPLCMKPGCDQFQDSNQLWRWPLSSEFAAICNVLNTMFHPSHSSPRDDTGIWQLTAAQRMDLMPLRWNSQGEFTGRWNLQRWVGSFENSNQNTPSFTKCSYKMLQFLTKGTVPLTQNEMAKELDELRLEETLVKASKSCHCLHHFFARSKLWK